MHVVTKSRLNNAVQTAVSTTSADLVRAGFDPSEHPTVDRIKMLAAALISECERIGEDNLSACRHALIAIQAAEEAAMWGVKAAPA